MAPRLTPAGLEPSITALKGLCPCLLDEGAWLRDTTTDEIVTLQSFCPAILTITVSLLSSQVFLKFDFHKWAALDSNQECLGHGFMLHPRIELGIYMFEILDYFY